MEKSDGFTIVLKNGKTIPVIESSNSSTFQVLKGYRCFICFDFVCEYSLQHQGWDGKCNKPCCAQCYTLSIKTSNDRVESIIKCSSCQRQFTGFADKDLQMVPIPFGNLSEKEFPCLEPKCNTKIPLGRMSEHFSKKHKDHEIPLSKSEENFKQLHDKLMAKINSAKKNEATQNTGSLSSKSCPTPASQQDDHTHYDKFTDQLNTDTNKNFSHGSKKQEPVISLKQHLAVERWSKTVGATAIPVTTFELSRKRKTPFSPTLTTEKNTATIKDYDSVERNSGSRICNPSDDPSPDKKTKYEDSEEGSSSSFKVNRGTVNIAPSPYTAEEDFLAKEVSFVDNMIAQELFTQLGISKELFFKVNCDFALSSDARNQELFDIVITNYRKDKPMNSLTEDVILALNSLNETDIIERINSNHPDFASHNEDEVQEPNWIYSDYLSQIHSHFEEFMVYLKRNDERTVKKSIITIKSNFKNMTIGSRGYTHTFLTHYNFRTQNAKDSFKHFIAALAKPVQTPVSEETL